MTFAADDKLANGCWARLYDKENFSGNILVLVGPVDIPTARPSSATGLELGRNYDSVAVGQNATLTVWDNENYRDKTAVFKSGQRVANLDNKMGYFEEIKSLKITCSK
jgi:Beta/Gamma crystallin